MKFTVKSSSPRSSRLGELGEIKGKPDVSLETPLALLHTQGGHIPHLTHEVFKLVSKEPQILQIPLVSMHNYHEAMRLYDGRVSEFVGCNDALTCITLHDPSNLTKQGHHMKEKVPIFTKSGKVFYDSEKYMEMIERFRPDMYVLLSDGDTNISSPQKRIVKASENTVTFNQQCIDYHKNSTILQDAFVIAPIAGGYCLRTRQKCLDSILKNDSHIQGYMIDGLHNNGPEVEFLPFSEVKPIVENVLERVGPEKLRVVQGCWSPLNVIKLVNCGIDVFDTSYCRVLTERSAAIIFVIDSDEQSESYEINLRQTKFADDFRPLLLGCECLACSGYSRGYIHHLLTVQELLGSVLIMIHNIHHILRFFKKIRECIRLGNLNDLEDRIATQYKFFQCQEDGKLILDNTSDNIG